jgi:hypothetical protein
VTEVAWPGETKKGFEDPVELIRRKDVDLVVNIHKNTQLDELNRGSTIRRLRHPLAHDVDGNQKVYNFGMTITKGQPWYNDRLIMKME